MRGGRVQTRINIDIEHLDHVANFRQPLVKRAEDLIFTFVAMGNIGVNKRRWLCNSRAMCWPNRAKFARPNIFEAIKIVTHMAIGRAHNTG